MEEAVRTHDASREAVRDITPTHLRATIHESLDETSMLPGVLVFLSADAADGSMDGSAAESRAAGVQLIYQGLALTRSLAREDPWAASDGPNEDANVRILAADVMVSRGFSLLARTDAAEKAVETVQTFGRTETERDADTGRPHANALERDVFELAVVAGTAAADVVAATALRKFVAELAHTLDGTTLPEAEVVVTRSVRDMLAKLVGARGPIGMADDAVWQSSATDP